MIVYDKLWQTLKQKGISQYRLINEFHISSGQLDRLRKNSNVNTYTLNQLCEMLDLKYKTVCKFVREGKIPRMPDGRKIRVAKIEVINYVLQRAQNKV